MRNLTLIGSKKLAGVVVDKTLNITRSGERRYIIVIRTFGLKDIKVICTNMNLGERIKENDLRIFYLIFYKTLDGEYLVYCDDSNKKSLTNLIDYDDWRFMEWDDKTDELINFYEDSFKEYKKAVRERYKILKQSLEKNLKIEVLRASENVLRLL